MLQVKDYAKTLQQTREPSHPSRSSAKAHEKGKGGDPKIQPEEGGRGFFSILAIFILIAVLFAAYRQYIRHKTLTQPKTPAPAAQITKSTSPQFDFYTVLPSGSTPGTTQNANSSGSSTPPPANSLQTSTGVTTSGGAVSTPASPTDATTVATTATTAPVQTIGNNTSQTAAASNPQFYLNAGDFANSADAEQMLSQLLLLGVQASIKMVQDNGASAYEVLVGPYADQDAMNIVKSQLAAHQIEASVVQE